MAPNPRASLPETRSVKQHLTTHCITKIQSYYIPKVLISKSLIEWKIMAWDGMECKWNQLASNGPKNRPESPGIDPN